MVQVQSIPTGTVKARIVSIEPIGTTVTYDIGVYKNHNFVANDVLVHNCQHDAAASMAHLHNVLEPDFILGLSATPFRTDRVKLCFDKVVKDAGIHQLVQDGYLSRFEHFNVDNWNPETVAERYCAEPERWGSSVVFFHAWDDCLKFKDILRSREDEIVARLREFRPDLALRRSLVESVRGGGTKSDYDDRDELLADFRAGDVAVLVNCMVLTEGFDAPNLETAFVRDSMKGPTMQMAGRAFRMHPKWKNEKDEAFKFKKVVQSGHTKWPILKTVMADRQYTWQDDQWRSLTLNPHIESINKAARIAISMVNVDLPKWMTDRTKKSQPNRRFGNRNSTSPAN